LVKNRFSPGYATKKDEHQMNAAEVRDEQAMIKMMIEPKRRKGWSKLTPDQRELAESFVPLARKLAKGWKAIFRNDKPDFDSAVCMAVVEAARTYKPEFNVKFSTFARFRIQGALRTMRRDVMSNRRPRELTNISVIGYVPGMEDQDGLMLTTRDVGVGKEFEDTEEVKHWFNKLPRRHAIACSEMYIFNRTQREVAQKLRCSKSRVCSLHAEAIELLRESREVQNAALEIGLDARRN
jgi:RNA polymerase sigma factor (sigma-70 family)